MNRAELSPLLSKLHDKLSAVFGENLHALYLYGSRARGDAQTDSDIDILVVLRSAFNYFEAVQKSSYITAALSLEYDTVISCVFVTRHDFEQRRTPLLINARQEGVLI